MLTTHSKLLASTGLTSTTLLNGAWQFMAMLSQPPVRSSTFYSHLLKINAVTKTTQRKGHEVKNIAANQTQLRCIPLSANGTVKIFCQKF